MDIGVLTTTQYSTTSLNTNEKIQRSARQVILLFSSDIGTREIKIAKKNNQDHDS